MATKYYTRFLLQTLDQADVDEYSGVVEVKSAPDTTLEASQIEALLASSFDLESGQIQLLNWSPLH